MQYKCHALLCEKQYIRQIILFFIANNFYINNCTVKLIDIYITKSKYEQLSLFLYNILVLMEKMHYIYFECLSIVHFIIQIFNKLKISKL